MAIINLTQRTNDAFHLHSGVSIYSLSQLVSQLNSMANYEFAAYVNTTKNDFASWIEHVYHADSLAAKLRQTTNRVDTIRIIDSELNDIAPPQDHVQELEHELYEREINLKEFSKELKRRKDELDRLESHLKKREIMIVHNEEKYRDMLQREHELEDLQITLKREQEELDHNKTLLLQKQSDTARTEMEIERRENTLRKERQELRKEKVTHNFVTDDAHELKKKYYTKMEHQHLKPRENLESAPMTTETFVAQIRQSYAKLSAHDIDGAKSIYSRLADQYHKMTATTGHDSQLYNDLLDLYKDIHIAIEHIKS